MKKALCFTVLAMILLASPAWSQNNSGMTRRFTNQEIISLVQLGISDDVIIAKIRAMSATAPDSISFDTSAQGLKTLKAANVSDSVITVMINPAPARATVMAGSAPMTMDPSLPPPEIGVYWKNGVNFVLIQGQALTNAKVGGKAGSLFTNGLRNEHWDATVDGPTSKNVVRERKPSFYFYVPDGSDAVSYTHLTLPTKRIV